MNQEDVKQYCVWDAIYGDFLENFATKKDAEEYCSNQLKNVKGVLVVGKWINPNLESSAYKEVCRFFSC